MRRIVLLLVSVLLLLGVDTAFAQQVMQDVIYLKNGSIVRGVIVEQVPNSSVKIRTNDGSEFVYAISDVLKMTKEASLQQPLLQRKSPVEAFVFSFLVPGLGQYYNGGRANIIKGLIQDGAYVGGAVMALRFGNDNFNASNCDSYYSSGGCNGYYYYTIQRTSWRFDAGLGMMVGASLWSMIDAPLSANSINNSINRRGAQTTAHMMMLKHGDDLIGFDVAPVPRGVGAQLSYQFR